MNRSLEYFMTSIMQHLTSIWLEKKLQKGKKGKRLKSISKDNDSDALCPLLFFCQLIVSQKRRRKKEEEEGRRRKKKNKKMRRKRTKRSELAREKRAKL